MRLERVGSHAWPVTRCAILTPMASVRRKLTSDEYRRLVEAGIVGPVELLDGRVVIGAFELAFSDAQIAAASDVDVDVGPADAIAAVGGTLDRRAYPSGYLKREREGWRE
jgi:hypothetical protein